MSQSTPAAIDALFAANYLSLSTRRKNGSRVDTPVWFAGTPAAFYLFSAADAGKIKRLRNFSDVRVAPCSVNGKVLGQWLPAEANLIDDSESITQAYAALKEKYRWQLALIDFVSRLGGRYKPTPIGPYSVALVRQGHPATLAMVKTCCTIMSTDHFH